MLGNTRKINPLELRQALLGIRDPLLSTLHLHLQLVEPHLHLWQPLPKHLHLALGCPFIIHHRLQLRVDQRQVVLILGHHLWRHLVRLELARHAALLHSRATARHGTARINQLASKGDDSPALFAVADPLRLRKVLSDEGVEDALEKGGLEALIFGFDQVKQARNAFGGLDGSQFASGQLFEHHEARTADIALTEMLDAGLSLFHSVNDEVV